MSSIYALTFGATIVSCCAILVLAMTQKCKTVFQLAVNPLSLILGSFYLAFFFQVPLVNEGNTLFSFTVSDLTRLLELALVALTTVVIAYFMLPLFLSKSNSNSAVTSEMQWRELDRKSKRIVWCVLASGLLLKLYLLSAGSWGYTVYSDDTPFNNWLVNGFLTINDVATFLFITNLVIKKEKERLDFIVGSGCVIVALLSGFKGAVAALIFCFFVSYIIKFKRPRLAHVVVALFLAITTFIFVEGYRQYKRLDLSYRDFSSLVFFVSARFSVDGGNQSFLWRYFNRSNLLDSSVAGVRYESNGGLESFDPSRPDFLGKILYSPVLAFVPRAVWSDKPVNLDGLWYTREVIGSPYITFTPPGKVIYLYFAGGTLCLILGFFFMGVALRLLSTLIHRRDPISIAKYIYFLSILTSLEMSFDYYLINIYYGIVIFAIVSRVLTLVGITDAPGGRPVVKNAGRAI